MQIINLVLQFLDSSFKSYLSTIYGKTGFAKHEKLQFFANIIFLNLEISFYSYIRIPLDIFFQKRDSKLYNQRKYKKIFIFISINEGCMQHYTVKS